MNADIWKAEVLRMLRNLMANPASDTEFFACLGFAALAMIVALRVTSSAFGLKLTGWFAVFIVFSMTAILTLAAEAAVRLYVLKPDSPVAVRIVAQSAVAVLGVLLIGLPLQCLLQKGTFLEALLATGTAILAAFLLTLAFRAGWQTLRSGSGTFDKVRLRKEAIEADSGTATPPAKR